jgi:16S rRNA (cytosine1402-N4)-methyltransferase
MWTPSPSPLASNAKVTHRATQGTPRAAGDAVHKPVLLDEILQFFAPEAGQTIIDGTLGFGGHSERILQAGANVIGVDQDREALERAIPRLESFGERFQPVRGNAEQLPSLLAQIPSAPHKVDAILFDLGVSSWQLDQVDRGFSFQTDGPLDMRMNPNGATTAADLVNTLDQEELANILFTFGEERGSRAVAKAIVERRQERPFETTLDLANVISRWVRRSGKIHPATRSFQALRIAVNRELDVLPTMLSHAVDLLNPGGKLAVISFHSLEDRIVKHFIRDHSKAMVDDPTWPAPRQNPDYHFDLPCKLIQASKEECVRNPRARSAKLRFAIRRA